MTVIDVSDYGAVADEYYDSSAHPTCAHFRVLSQRYVSLVVTRLARRFSCCLEVGAGRSILAEMRAAGGLTTACLVVSDIEQKMLDASRDHSEHVDEFLLLDARDVPAAQGLRDRFDLVVASMADPYDDDQFWRSLSVLVTAGGSVIMTTPSHEWADQFRASEPGDSRSLARFETENGRVWLPSMVRTVDDEIALIERNGFRVVESEPLYLAQGPGVPSAPKLRSTAELGMPVCVGYHAIRL